MAGAVAWADTNLLCARLLGKSRVQRAGLGSQAGAAPESLATVIIGRISVPNVSNVSCRLDFAGHSRRVYNFFKEVALCGERTKSHEKKRNQVDYEAGPGYEQPCLGASRCEARIVPTLHEVSSSGSDHFYRRMVANPACQCFRHCHRPKWRPC